MLPSSFDPPSSEWSIGSKGGGGARIFVGHIADVQLWSVPLSQAHVTSLATDQSASVPRPVARWALDDDSGGKQAQVFGVHVKVLDSVAEALVQDSSASIDPSHATLKGSACIKPAKANDAPSSSSSSSSSGSGSSANDRRLCVT
jgi:hypothetical protein